MEIQTANEQRGFPKFWASDQTMWTKVFWLYKMAQPLVLFIHVGPSGHGNEDWLPPGKTPTVKIWMLLLSFQKTSDLQLRMRPTASDNPVNKAHKKMNNFT